MQSLVLPGTDLTVSRLSLGTASLLSAGSRRNRDAVIGAALDAGFTHFDTAPLYGFGNAERDLGRVIGNRADCTVATKVGLRSPGGDDQSAVGAVLRKAAGKAIPALSAAQADFALAWARRSLEGSLRRLRRDAIDIYLLHEPELALIDHDGWLRWLEDVKTQGKVRHFGLAVLADRAAPFLDRASPLCEVLQLSDSVPGHEADVLNGHDREMQITFGYIRGSADLSPMQALAAGLARNRTGSVIYGTRKPERLAAAAELAR
ncbi:aldo/keto reductase [Novosphingobium sp. B 225]|uniref:aldo/keto reductase n=1 Tax=Novosphingobium sp. B 225 TaxID=1961849 RepID=UPI000B4B9551|nr:aldo/keto reductase [Novosphingobium sp. B 225]